MVHVREERLDGDPPRHVHPGWARAYPWLVQGTTGRGGPDGDWDFGLSGAAPVGDSLRRWRLLQSAADMDRVVHSRQAHLDRVLSHDSGPPGLALSDGFDVHYTQRADVLLTVSVADCTPIFIVDCRRRRIALLHAGWRGTAHRIIERGLEPFASDLAAVQVHLGPAICGPCYEVGPEVHQALRLPAPCGPATIDMRSLQARQLVEAGVPAANVSVSRHCTRCSTDFYSHRGGDASRQLGFLGIAEAP